MSPAGSGSAWPGWAASPDTGRATSSCAVSTDATARPRFASGRVSVELLADDDIGELFTATVDATEEAVTNALFVADTVVGRDGNTAPASPSTVDLLSSEASARRPSGASSPGVDGVAAPVLE